MRDFHAAREAKRRRSKCAPRRGYLLSDARLLPALCFFVPRATKFQRAIKPTGGAGEGTEGCAPPSNPFVATKAANLRRTRRHQLVHTGRCSKGPPTMRGNLAARNGKYERDKERERERGRDLLLPGNIPREENYRATFRRRTASIRRGVCKASKNRVTAAGGCTR